MSKLSQEQLLSAIEYVTVESGTRLKESDEAYTDIVEGLKALSDAFSNLFDESYLSDVKPEELIRRISKVSVTGIWVIASLVAGSEEKTAKKVFIPPSAQ